MEHEKTVTGLLEEISDEFCGNYCKYRETLKGSELEEHCGQCPLMKI